MHRLLTSALTLMFLIVGVTHAAERTRVELEARAWDPGASGSIQVLAEGFGTAIDLDGDLGLEGDVVTDFRVTFRPSRKTMIRLSSVPLEYAGDEVVSRTITFAGQSFTLATRVASRLELDYVRAAFAWQFLASADNRFRIGPIVELKGFDGTASLAAPDLDPLPTATENFEAAFGSAGLIFDLEPNDRVHVFGEFTVLVGADEGDQTELEAGARVALWGPLHAVVGFRSIQFTFDDERDLVDLDMDGGFFGVSLRF